PLRTARACGLCPGADLYETALIYVDLPNDTSAARAALGWRQIEGMVQPDPALRAAAVPARTLSPSIWYSPPQLTAAPVPGLLAHLSRVLAAMAHLLDGTVGDLRALLRAASRS